MISGWVVGGTIRERQIVIWKIKLFFFQISSGLLRMAGVGEAWGSYGVPFSPRGTSGGEWKSSFQQEGKIAQKSDVVIIIEVTRVVVLGMMITMMMMITELTMIVMLMLMKMMAVRQSPPPQGPHLRWVLSTFLSENKIQDNKHLTPDAKTFLFGRLFLRWWMRGFFFKIFYEFQPKKKNQRQKRISQGKRFKLSSFTELGRSYQRWKNLFAFWAAPE